MRLSRTFRRCALALGGGGALSGNAPILPPRTPRDGAVIAMKTSRAQDERRTPKNKEVTARTYLLRERTCDCSPRLFVVRDSFYDFVSFGTFEPLHATEIMVFFCSAGL